MSVMDLGSYLGVDHRFFGPLRGARNPGRVGRLASMKTETWRRGSGLAGAGVGYGDGSKDVSVTIATEAAITAETECLAAGQSLSFWPTKGTSVSTMRMDPSSFPLRSILQIVSAPCRPEFSSRLARPGAA